MILDLNTFKEETLDVILPKTEEVISVKKPTERLFVEFLKFSEFGTEEHTAEEQMQALNSLVLLIMNNNNTRKLVKKEIDSLTYEMKLTIIQTYSEWIKNISNQKN